MTGKIYTVLMIIILIIAFACILFLTRTETKEFVDNRGVEKYSDAFFDYEIIKYPTDVKIYEPNASERITVGIVSDTNNMKFGIIPGNGSYAKRYLNLTNREKDAKIFLHVYGDITPLVRFGKNNFIIRENENVMIDVLLNTKGSEFKEYSGEIDVVIQRPKFDFLYSFL